MAAVTTTDGRPERGSSAGARILTWLTSPFFRLVMLLVIVIVAVVIGARADGSGVASLRASFEGFGIAGPLLFAAAYAVAATVMLPASPFTIGAGVLFGPVVGTATALVGATVGATGALLLGRLLGRDAVDRFGGRRVVALDRYLARRGFVSLLIIRLVPLFPFNLVNLAAGVAGMGLRDFVLATSVGIVPGTVAYAALGGTIEDPSSPAFLIAVAIFVLVTVVAAIASRRLRRRDGLSEDVS